MNRQHYVRVYRHSRMVHDRSGTEMMTPEQAEVANRSLTLTEYVPAESVPVDLRSVAGVRPWPKQEAPITMKFVD